MLQHLNEDFTFDEDEFQEHYWKPYLNLAAQNPADNAQQRENKKPKKAKDSKDAKGPVDPLADIKARE